MNCKFSRKYARNPTHLFRVAASVFYWLIAASIAELASAMPSSGGGASNPLPHLGKLTLR
jgi:hypothetical protein